MKKISVTINDNSSVQVKDTNLIISARTINRMNYTCEVIVGYAGLKNINKTMSVGDTALFESPEDGVFEVRMMHVAPFSVDVLISQISPNKGLLGGFVEGDQTNSIFTAEELSKISKSINNVKNNLSINNNISSPEFELISRKLDQIEEASNRLGRKDWINYVAGTLTSLCISAAFSTDVTTSLFQSVNAAFSWFFDSTLRLLLSSSS